MRNHLTQQDISLALSYAMGLIQGYTRRLTQAVHEVHQEPRSATSWEDLEHYLARIRALGNATITELHELRERDMAAKAADKTT